MRQKIQDIIEAISPFDEVEAAHRQDALNWIKSGVPLFRVQKPDVPPKHIVSYFAVFDPKNKKILLQDHLLAKRWLAPGGHVDPDEDPAETVRRECVEELGIEAKFLHPDPQFVTVTVTNGQGEHTDVSLWYILEADYTTELTIEPDRFAEVRWWDIDDVLAASIDIFDPCMHRFIRKLQRHGFIFE